MLPCLVLSEFISKSVLIILVTPCSMAESQTQDEHSGLSFKHGPETHTAVSA